MTHEYEGVRRVVYGGKKSEYHGATFVPVCPICGRFVKADDRMGFRGGTITEGSNATCHKCGRVEMLFEGFMGDDDATLGK